MAPKAAKSMMLIFSPTERIFYTAGRHQGPATGFTLIELIVVITIIAIMASMAVLSMNLFSPTRFVKNEAERFNALVHLLQDESILTAREYGLIIYQNGVRVVEWYEPTKEDQERYQKSLKKEGEELPADVPPLPGHWRGISGGDFKPSHLYSDGIEVLAWVEGAELDLSLLEDDEELFALLEEAKNAEKLTAKLIQAQFDAAKMRPALLFLSSGEATAFRTRLTWREDPNLRFEISSDIMGNITYLRPGEEWSE